MPLFYSPRLHCCLDDLHWRQTLAESYVSDDHTTCHHLRRTALFCLSLRQLSACETAKVWGEYRVVAGYGQRCRTNPSITY